MMQILGEMFINVSSVAAIILLMQYVFGADIQIKGKYWVLLLSAYYAAGCILEFFWRGIGTLVSVFLFLILVILFLCRKKKGKVMIFYVIPAILVEVQFGCLINLLNHLLHMPAMQGNYAYTYNSTLYYLSDVFLMVLLIGFACWTKKKGWKHEMTIGECLFISLLGILSPFYAKVLELIITLAAPNHVMMYQVIWILFVLIFNLCIVITFVNRKRAGFYLDLSESYRSGYEQEYQAFEQYREKQRELDKLRHDWKNHAGTVKQLWEKGEKEEAIAYMDSLTGEMEKNQITILTGNEVVDILLAMKKERMDKLQIAFSFVGSLSGLQAMDTMDTCILFGNLLDNAIESCEKAEADRWIRIKVSENKNIFMLHMENLAEEKMEKQHFKTRKKQKELHGLGLQLISAVVKKYKGEISVKCSEGIFQTDICLPAS